MLADQVEREQRVAQVVEHAHEEHEVEPLAQRADVVDRELAELDLEPSHLGGEARLGEVALVAVDAEHARGAAPLHLDGVEAGVAADVEHGLAGQVGRDRVGEAPPLHRRVVAEEMVGRGPTPSQVDVVEPGPERLDLARGLVGCTVLGCRHGAVPSLGHALSAATRVRQPGQSSTSAACEAGAIEPTSRS